MIAAVVKDVPYRTAPDATDYERDRCKLDLYLPGGTGPTPIVVWFHGGGLEGGEKTDPATVAIAECLTHAAVGMAVPNYRLSPKARYPAYVDDAAASVAWVIRRLQDQGRAPGGVFIAGHSAGGYLAALVGMDPRYLARHGVCLADIAGIIPVSGQMMTHFTVRKERGVRDPEHTPVMDDAAPCHHVHKEAPPVLAICGDRDWPARAEENRLFVALLRYAGHASAVHRECRDRDHGTIIEKMPTPGDPALEAILAFIRQQAGPA